MSEPTRHPAHDGTPIDSRIRRSWWIFAGTIFLLGLLLAARLFAEGARPLDWVVVALLGLVGITAIRHREAVEALETGRREEAESFARILSGLSRSVSEDAIVGAIVEELAASTGADHIVVARQRLEARALQATLISARPGVPPSTTLLPMAEFGVGFGVSRSVTRAAVAVPVRAEVPAPVPVGAGTGPGRPSSAGSSRTGRHVSVADGGWRARGESLIGALPGLVTDTEAGQAAADRVADQVRAAYGLTHMLAAPLRGRDGVVGAIVLSRRSQAPWPAATRRLLNGAALEASAALSRAGSHRAAEVEASTDALTGLPNRRYFDEFCGLLARRRRAEDAVGVLMVDIDRFKVLNDTHGHAAGDEVLKAVGGAIVRAVRDDDVPARYGGEEFVVLLRNPSGPVALEIGERVRAAVAGLDLAHLRIAKVTVSVGVAVAEHPDEPIGELIERADRALYRAKRAGRDRVVAL